MAAAAPDTIDAIADDGVATRLTAAQVRVLVLCFLVVLVDGYDLAAIGYIAPALHRAWGLTPAQLAPAFGAGLFGLMAGSLVFGPLADRWGRKPVLMLSMAVFAAGTLACAFSTSIEMLIGLRLVTGVGLGGAAPTCIALCAEVSPARRRMLLVTLAASGFTLGLALGGLLAAQIIPAFGWRGVFAAGAVAPLALLPLLAALLIESPRFLAARSTAALASAEIASAEPASPVSHLFSGGLAPRTLLLWLTFFASLFMFYLLTSWLPTLMTRAGLSIADAARVGAMVPLGGTLGAIVLALAVDRDRSPRVLVAAYVFSALALVAVGQAMGHHLALMAAVFAAGFGIAGAQNGINLLAATMYPTAARTTGVAWASAAGRVGSIAGSMLGAPLLAAASGPQALFASMALPALVAAAALAALGWLLGRDAPPGSAPQLA